MWRQLIHKNERKPKGQLALYLLREIIALNSRLHVALIDPQNRTKTKVTNVVVSITGNYHFEEASSSGVK